MQTFLRTHRSVEAVNGLHASRSKPKEQRTQERALNKIKRAICEITKCNGDSVIIDRRARHVFVYEEGDMKEMATVSETGEEVWKGAGSEEIRRRAAELLRPEQ